MIAPIQSHSNRRPEKLFEKFLTPPTAGLDRANEGNLSKWIAINSWGEHCAFSFSRTTMRGVSDVQFVFVLVLLPLFFGALVYALWSPSVLLQHIQGSGLRPMSVSPSIDGWKFIRDSLPDFLWAFSLANGISFVWLRSASVLKYLFFIIALTCAILFECMQMAKILAGTGSICDMVIYSIAFCVSFLTTKVIKK